MEPPRRGGRCERDVEAGGLIPIALACTLAVLGGAFALDTAHAGPSTRHTCSAPDRQFLQTVDANMTQLGFWSQQLGSGQIAPGVVVRQAFSEAAQIGATFPTDPTLFRARGMLRVMLQEYGRAIRARSGGSGAAGRHMGLSWQLAGDVHELLAAARPQLAALGCDPQPLLAGD